MGHKLLILGTFAGLAATLPTWAAEKAATPSNWAPGTTRNTIMCRGSQNVPVTADAEQALPMQLVARLNCGAEVAVESDTEGYTVRVRTVEGKAGYVARIYLSENPVAAKNRRTTEAAVNNGIARWQSGAPGTDQFYSNGSLVESLTANGVTVQVSLQDTDWKLRAHVAIVNDSDEQIHFNPAGFTLDELTPRLRALAYQNPVNLAKALTHQVYWTNASATAPASATYVSASYKPSGYIPATPNYLAAEQNQQVLSTVLQAQSLEPRQKASGVVWFERDKNPQQLNLRVFVGDQIFEFPLSFPQHN